MFTATERGRSAGEWVQFGIAVLLVAAMFYPTVWMVLSAFKTDREIFRTPFALPDTWRWENFAKAWEIGQARHALSQLAVRHRGGGDACASAAPRRRHSPSRGWNSLGGASSTG